MRVFGDYLDKFYKYTKLIGIRQFYLEYESMKTHSEKEMLVLINNKTSRSILYLISVLLIIAKDFAQI